MGKTQLDGTATAVEQVLTPSGAMAGIHQIDASYAAVRRAAGMLMRRERRDHTLQATALVHEAFLRVMRDKSMVSRDERATIPALVRAMRLVLVDHARKRNALKRSASGRRVTLEQADAHDATHADELLLEVDASLDALRAQDPDLADVVELRFFVGLDEAQSAELMGISPRTVRRRWRVARYWLAQSLDLR